MAVTSFRTSSMTTGSKRARVWDQFSSPGNFESIATNIVGAGGASFILFSNIPQTYNYLEIRLSAQTTDTANSGLGNNRINGYFNGDETATNYYSHYLDGYGTGVGSAAEQNAKWAGDASRTNSSGWGTSIITILDYTNTNKFKTVRSFSAVNTNDSNNGLSRMGSGLWRSTAAITSIKIVPESGTLKQNSSFALYGVI
jgi:hypothetical protein